MAEKEPFSFSPLFASADRASNRHQKNYLWLIRAEYFFLFLSACLAMSGLKTPDFIVTSAGIFFGAVAAMAWRAHSKPEQAWYKCRALAESVKTLSWRFSMRSPPYDDELVADARADFRENLSHLLRTNSELGSSLAEFNDGGPQVTPEMMQLRGSSLVNRKSVYIKHRVRDQQNWYQRKARSNVLWAKGWLICAFICYAAGMVMILAPLHTPSLTMLPMEPIIVVASAILGWMQIKKFNELASAYALTAQEIGIAEGKIADAEDEGVFSKAVNEVELVFSREHTQWIARLTV